MSESLKTQRRLSVKGFDEAMPQECGLLRSEQKILLDLIRTLQSAAYVRGMQSLGFRGEPQPGSIAYEMMQAALDEE